VLSHREGHGGIGVGEGQRGAGDRYAQQLTGGIFIKALRMCSPRS
jgi:hypothetical protein